MTRNGRQTVKQEQIQKVTLEKQKTHLKHIGHKIGEKTSQILCVRTEDLELVCPHCRCSNARIELLYNRLNVLVYSFQSLDIDSNIARVRIRVSSKHG